MVWGFTDHIWFPTQWLAGEKPAIFDGDYHPKPAFFALQKLLAEGSSE
jgi:GH35 family endo-1,4-beta-xylanase